MFRKLIFAVACILLLAGAPAVQAACPAGFALLDLKTGTLTNNLSSYVSYHTFPGVISGAPAPVPAAGCSGWKMAAFKIVIPGAPNTCTQANIVVEYEGTPKLWSTNLGDSATNDGFAGDAGTTNHEAELWILDENLSLAPADTLSTFGLGIDNPLVMQHLSLTDSSLKFVVKNQFVSWGQPYTLVQEPATQNLFAIPDTTVAAADQRAIYLGLNRVITGRLDRTGCGARRVMITFQ
ncbi:MAG TPA: hypothetical protein VII86_15930 [Thermoanaerobaculia bacterium]